MSEKPKVGEQFPAVEGMGPNGLETLARPTGKWHLIIVWRGAHCPRCKRYLAKLATLLADFKEIDVTVTGVTSDPRERADTFLAEIGIDFPYVSDFQPDAMRALGLYISNPRDDSETDRQFPEPGTFLINPDGALHIADISNSPAFRPDLDSVLSGTKFVIERNGPIRGLA